MQDLGLFALRAALGLHFGYNPSPPMLYRSQRHNGCATH